MKQHWPWVAVLVVSLQPACSESGGTTARHAAPTASTSPTTQPTAGPTAAPEQKEIPNAAADVAAYPVRWWSGLELKDLADAGKVYAATQTDAFGDLQRGDTTKRPRDCVEWTQLHADGYEPTSTVEAQTDSGSKLRCMTLLLLQRAQHAKVSYVRDLAWDRSLLSLLPAAVATAFNKEQENALKAATSKGLTLAQFDRKATVKPSREEHTVEIVEGDGQTMIVVHAEAWGDLNNDGVDDIALSVVNGATQGTYSYVRLLTLSRSSIGAMLTPVAVQ
jgi:hypothetical protein